MSTAHCEDVLVPLVGITIALSPRAGVLIRLCDAISAFPSLLLVGAPSHQAWSLRCHRRADMMLT